MKTLTILFAITITLLFNGQAQAVGRTQIFNAQDCTLKTLHSSPLHSFGQALPALIHNRLVLVCNDIKFNISNCLKDDETNTYSCAEEDNNRSAVKPSMPTLDDAYGK